LVTSVIDYKFGKSSSLWSARKKKNNFGSSSSSSLSGKINCMFSKEF